MGIQTSISLPGWGIHHLKFFLTPCLFPDFWVYLPLSPNFVYPIFCFLWITRCSFYTSIQGRPHKLGCCHNAGIQ